MATFKLEFVRTTTITGYVEADSAQDAVNKILYPHNRDSDGNIQQQFAPGDSGWEASTRGQTDVVKTLVDVSGGDVAVSPVPEAEKPADW